MDKNISYVQQRVRFSYPDPSLDAYVSQRVTVVADLDQKKPVRLLS